MNPRPKLRASGLVEPGNGAQKLPGIEVAPEVGLVDENRIVADYAEFRHFKSAENPPDPTENIWLVKLSAIRELSKRSTIIVISRNSGPPRINDKRIRIADFLTIISATKCSHAPLACRSHPGRRPAEYSSTSNCRLGGDSPRNQGIVWKRLFESRFSS